MSKKSATDKIKGLNPKNISGVVPQALDLIQQLKKSKGNPPMVDAVGMQNLMGMLQFVAQKFSQNQVKNPLTLEQILNTMDIASLNIQRQQFVVLAKEILGVLNLKDVYTVPMDLLDRIGELLAVNRDIRNIISNLDEILLTVLTNLRNMRV